MKLEVVLKKLETELKLADVTEKTRKKILKHVAKDKR